MPPRKKQPPATPRRELAALLNACKAEPDDDAPRLVLSDWLEENGEPERAELVRVQCRRAHAEGPERQALEARAEELLGRHGDAWLASFRERKGWGATLGRGLVWFWASCTSQASAKAMLELAETEAWAWVEDLSLGRVTPGPLTALAGSRLPPEVREFSQDGAATDEVATVIATTPAFSGLRRLRLGRGFTRAGAEAISGAAHLATLVSFDLSDSQVGVDGLSLLLGSPHFPRVEEMNLHGCLLGPGGARAIAGSAGMTGLRSIDFHRNTLGDEGLAALAGTSALPSLRALMLRDNGLADAGPRALAASVLMGRLTALDIGDNRISLRAIEALVGSPRCGSLESLDISDAYLGDEVGRVLAASRHLGRLRRLCLGSNDIGPAGVRALLEATWMRGLEELKLECNELGDEGAAALAAAPALAGCRILSIWGGKDISPAGAIALARSPHLKGLRRLEMTCHPIGDKGARAVLESPHLAGLHKFEYSNDGLSPAVLAALRARRWY